MFKYFLNSSCDIVERGAVPGVCRSPISAHFPPPDAQFQTHRRCVRMRIYPIYHSEGKEVPNAVMACEHDNHGNDLNFRTCQSILLELESN